MYQLKPKNKYAWIETIDEANKVGMLFTPGNMSNQYRMAKLLAFDSDCPEAVGYEVGQTVLYDTIGEVAHRVGNQTIKTVKIMNILGIITEKEQG